MYSFFLSEIGSDEALIKLSSQINQFLSGVFLAINKNTINLKIEQLKVGTEDEQFRSLPLEGILIEIRAFDTSLFEIYTEDKKIIKELTQKFNIYNTNNIKLNIIKPNNYKLDMDTGFVPGETFPGV